MQTLSESNGARSLQQSVTSSLDVGSLSLSFSQSFGDKRRKDSPRLTVGNLINPVFVKLEGEEGVKITQQPDARQELEYFHLVERDKDAFLVFGSTTTEKYLILRTDDQEVLDNMASSSVFGASLRDFTDADHSGFDLSPAAYQGLFKSLLSAQSGDLDWEQRVTERQVISIPLSFGADLGVSLGLDVNAETVFALSYIAQRGKIHDGAIFLTDRYEKDGYITGNIKGVDPFVDAGVNAIRDVASELIETVNAIVHAGVDLVVEIGEGVKATVKAGADILEAGTKVLISKIAPSKKSYAIKALSSKGDPSPDEINAATVGAVYIVNVTDENGVSLDVFPAPLELTISYSEADLLAAGFTLADAAKLRIYKWDSESGYYLLIGGVVDETARTVTANITLRGQYILAIDEGAPEVADFYVSNGTSLPGISFVVSDSLSGIETSSIHFLLDGVEVVNGSNYQGYFNPATGIFSYQVTSPLASGEHVAALTVTDILGNSVNFSRTFTVNSSPPLISHSPVAAAGSEEPLAITAQVTDDEELAGVFLYYRPRKDDLSYRVAEMTAPEGSQSYQADIPREVLTSFGVRYYISAIDASANASVTPFVDIAVSDVSNPEIPGELKITYEEGRFVVDWPAARDIDTLGYYVYLGENSDSMSIYEDAGFISRIFLDESTQHQLIAVSGYDNLGREGAMTVPVPVAFDGDLDRDRDVDGLDAAAFIQQFIEGGNSVSVEDFANNFGR